MNNVRAKRKPIRKWIRRFFFAWASFVLLYLGNSMRTQGVNPALLASDDRVTVVASGETLDFQPNGNSKPSSLVFICGSGVAAEAYSPLLRDIAAQGHSVHVVRLPLRFGPLESHKQTAIDRAMEIVHSSRDRQWVVAGHSLGGALAARIAREHSSEIDGVVLVGTTHPKEDDLSSLTLPITKVFGANDGVAPPEKVLKNRTLLPTHTQYVEIPGGNHSQFGHYGHQFMDGNATISRQEQQDQTRVALLRMLQQVSR